MSHIFATILIDGQVLVPQGYPQALRDLLQWYIEHTGDPLMTHPHPQWFVGAVVYEWWLQLPYCCCAAYFFSASVSQTNQKYPDWFRTYSIIYGTNTCTTMMLILHHLLREESATVRAVPPGASTTVPLLLLLLLLLQTTTTRGRLHDNPRFLRQNSGDYYLLPPHTFGSKFWTEE